jgi:hypothetical protein
MAGKTKNLKINNRQKQTTTTTLQPKQAGRRSKINNETKGKKNKNKINKLKQKCGK